MAAVSPIRAGALAAAVLLAAIGPPTAVAAEHDAPAPEAELLVKFHSGTSAAERADAHDEGGGRVDGRLRAEAVDVVDLERGQSADEALVSYGLNRDVQWAELNRRVAIAAAPDDLGARLWGLQNTGQDGGLFDADIDAPEAWDLVAAAAGAADYTVGVVDTGIDLGHEDLAGRAITDCLSALGGTGQLGPGCPDDNDHGTHAAGTIAAIPGNGRGVAGAAPGARVLMCKALGRDGSGFISDVVACMNDIVARRSALNIRVLSMSIGGGPSSTLEAAVNDAWNKGVLVVAAAGNDAGATTTYPAGYANAVSVGATDRTDAHASFSNQNPDVELSAPGVAIVSTVPGGYAAYNGTSMAAPHVAAAAALIAWKDGKAQQALRAALDQAVDDLGPAGRDPAFGYGRLNLCRALRGGCSYSAGAPPASRPVAPSTPAPRDGDRSPPRVRASWPARVRLRSALSGGIRVGCRADEPARCTLRAEMRASDARRLGLRSRPSGGVVAIGGDSTRLARGRRATLKARPTHSAGRRLAAARVPLMLRLTAVDRAGNRSTVARRVTLTARP